MINISINNPVICHLHVINNQLTISSTHFTSSIHLYQEAISYYEYLVNSRGGRYNIYNYILVYQSPLVNSMVATSPYQSTLVDTPMHLLNTKYGSNPTNTGQTLAKLSMNLLKGYYTFYICSTLTDYMSHDTQHTTSYMILWYAIMTGLTSHSGLYKHNLIHMCSSTQEQDDNIEGARVVGM